MSQSDQDQPTPADTTAYAGLRVGDTERKAAIAALGEQWQAGRLDPAEHERRTTAAFAATTRGDLDALFADLPAGAGPASGAPAGVVTATSSPSPAGEGATSWLARNRGAVYSMIPLIAVLLFFTVVRTWVVFLLIPIAYTLLGTVAGAPPGRDRHRNRRGGR